MAASLAGAIQVLGASYLLLAAATKLAAPRPITLTLSALNFRRPGAVRLLVVALELLGAVLILVRPASLVTQAAVLSLGVTFAGSGVMALTLGRRIKCNCFGGAGASVLGVRQLLLLPLWTALALLPKALESPLGGNHGIAVLIMISTALILLRMGPFLKSAHTMRVYLRLLQP